MAPGVYGAGPGTKVTAKDWPWWRGPNRNGVANGASYPVAWSRTKNVLWTATLPGRGHSTPTVVGPNVLLTTADEKAQTQSILCLDRATGKPCWQKVLHRGGFETEIHKKCSHAAASVASDGQRLFTVFLNHKAIWLTALDFSGRVLWQKKVCAFTSKFGFGASPLIHDGHVIIASDNMGGGFLTAYDRRTGKVVWNTPRQGTPSYSSANVARVAGRLQLLIAGGDKITSYNPTSGQLLWSQKGASVQTVSTMAFTDTLVFASGGYPTKETLCFDARGNGKLMWREKGNIANVPCMLVHAGSLYLVTDNGVAWCRDVATGKPRWSARLKGEFSASPTLAGDHIYAVNETGTVFIFKANPKKFESVAEITMGSEGFATPVACGGRIFLRVAEETSGKRIEKLYCVGRSKNGTP
ncbi:MAG: hypothetical protein CMJ62_21455 [Planctomycetaceae bacterium]|jgi:outer membrane protein assembly factor BamB|nr:hypothetical protein [Planctomycetaceae bacterium]|tara:strand:+ start:4847 stop:6082 length:1236 start_codon:yes stop_codon:yes gene_type:complete